MGAHMVSECPFCDQASIQIVSESVHALAFRDRYPISPGHTLVIPRRHVPTIFDLSREEESDVWELVRTVGGDLETELEPDGFNVGHNAGAAAGQTVGHAHIHVIPRYQGDLADPRGGIRWVIPDKAVYWD